MRLWQAAVLSELKAKYDVDVWGETSKLFEQSGKLIIQLSEAAMDKQKQIVSELMTQIDDIEEQAYTLLEQASPPPISS